MNAENKNTFRISVRRKCADRRMRQFDFRTDESPSIKFDEYVEENPFSELIETVSAYVLLTCFYDVNVVKHTFVNIPTAFETVENTLEKACEIDDLKIRRT